MARMSMLSVGIGVAALVITLSVLNGFNQHLQNRLLASEAHLVVELEKSATNLNLFNKTLFLSADAFEKQDVVLRSFDGSFSGAEAVGLDTPALQNLFSHSSQAHDFNVQQHLQPGDIIVPLELAQNLGLFEGDWLSVLPAQSLLLPVSAWPSFARLRVRKIRPSNETGLENLKIYYHRRHSRSFFPLHQFVSQGVQLRLHDPYALSEAQAFLQSRLKQQGVNKFNIQSWRQRHSTLFWALKLEKYVMTLFLALSMLITSFSIVTLVVLLKARKQRDMGVMMALGLSPRRVQSIFAGVGFGVFALAATSGLAVGTGVAYALHIWPLEILPDIYYQRHLPSQPSWQLIAGTAGGCAVLGLVTSCLPQFKALPPVAQLLR